MLADVNGGLPPSSDELSYIIGAVQSQSEIKEVVVPVGTAPYSFTRAEVWQAIACWWPHVHRRHLHPPPPKSSQSSESRRNVRSAMDHWDNKIDALLVGHDKVISAVQLEQIMDTLHSQSGSSKPVTPEELKFVLDTANATHEYILKSELHPALALWLALRDVQDRMDQQFATIKLLDRNRVASLLTELDGGLAPSAREVDWVMQTADLDGSGTLDHAELRRAVALWCE